MRSFFLVAILIVGCSVACSAYKSAGSPAASNDNSPVGQSADQAADANAQELTPCTITLAGAPNINGVKLGMTPSEVLALFPGSQEDKDIRESLAMPPSEFGVSNLTIRSANLASNEKFAGVSQVTFILLDGRVSSFTVNYKGPEFSHVDKFVAKFIEGKSLPPVEQWEPYVGMETQLKTLKCAGFEIRVNASGPGGNLNYVLMKDLVADQKLRDRRKKAREKATPTP